MNRVIVLEPSQNFVAKAGRKQIWLWFHCIQVTPASRNYQKTNFCCWRYHWFTPSLCLSHSVQVSLDFVHEDTLKIISYPLAQYYISFVPLFSLVWFHQVGVQSSSHQIPRKKQTRSGNALLLLERWRQICGCGGIGQLGSHLPHSSWNPRLLYRALGYSRTRRSQGTIILNVIVTRFLCIILGWHKASDGIQLVQ